MQQPGSSRATSRTILIEFNELSPRLLDRFIAEGHLPAFRAFRDSSVVFTTDAGEDPPALEPWIQWVTVHSGLPYSEHQVFALGDGRRKLTKPLLGDVLARAGVPVGIFSSMNTNYLRRPGDAGYVVPDPWDVDGVAYPQSLQPFYETVSAAVQESSRDALPGPAQLAKFGLFLVRNGLRPATVKQAIAQLVNEKRTGGGRWKRATVLDALNYDVFRALNKRFDVRFATFFSNSTAHYQHYYWRDLEPELFTEPGDGTYAEAVLHGYESMDRLLAKIMADYPDALLILATALSQEPWTDTEKRTYRPRDFAELLAFARVSGGVAKPMMAEQFVVALPGEQAAIRAEEQLRALVTDGGEPVLKVDRDGDQLQVGARRAAAADGAVVINPETGARRRHDELFYAIHTTRSGRHHRDGALWFRTGEHRVVPGRVPLTDIAPTILEHFGVPQPEHMKGKPLPLRAPASVR
ncbi:hypothetical protein SAMN05443637_104283 [Pseudonocardia thermophila]|uniref:Type I phosphodiesterase / nucleotide pyrophosphatase n=1 Tax=Pseudonocardia thermophila TaxID=1848 RepID=A0A1M6RBE5_PSETH|nr:hypothetical protein [Pseudonocardia thermophila]SHK29783.1 hypothetical protein SAMN05443637_104283 [Pseudonocardia thermophila]